MSASRPCSSLPCPKAAKEREYFIMETRGRYIGPMPVDLFIDQFLPTEKVVDIQESVAGFFDQVKTNKLEIDMYQPFIDAIKPHLGGFKVENTSVMSSTVQMGENKLKPDVAIYADDSERKDEKRTDFSAIEICIELKRSTLHDPFDDADGAPFEKNTELGMSMRGQITAYATAHLGKQFRLFAFSVIILGDMARIMRWERAGSTVTKAFNYKQNPEILINFFRRFASLSRKDRGWDTSVIPIDETQPPSDIHSDIVLAARAALNLLPKSSLFCIQVRATDRPDTSESLEFRCYIGGRPPCPYSLIGRSTRGWPVFCVTTKQVVFLKDTWRINSDDIEPEGVTYRKLHEKNVHNIATVEASGDVGYSTVTQLLTNEPWSKVKEKITGHVHYRLVLKEVGRRLTDFLCTRDLVSAVRDAIIALWEAFELAKILHRDISVGNMVIILDGNGKFTKALLIDWDLCKDITKLGSRRRDRTGTWQFMSAALLREVNKEHTIGDDLESSLHVLTWTMLRYVPHNIEPLTLKTHLQRVFDEYCSITGTGGDSKGRALGAGDYIPLRLELKRPSPLLELLRTLSDPFICVYGQPRRMGAPEPLIELSKQNAASPQWFVETIEAALRMDSWPKDDGSSALLKSRTLKRPLGPPPPPPPHSFEEQIYKRLRFDSAEG